MRHVPFVVFCSLLLWVGGALPSAAQQAYDTGPWPDNAQQSAVFDGGELFAGPFEAIADVVRLDDGTAVLTDPALGLVVAAGGRLGIDQQGLGVKGVVADGLNNPATILVQTGVLVVQTDDQSLVIETEGLQVAAILDGDLVSATATSAGVIACSSAGSVTLSPATGGPSTIIAAVSAPAEVIPLPPGEGRPGGGVLIVQDPDRVVSVDAGSAIPVTGDEFALALLPSAGGDLTDPWTIEPRPDIDVRALRDVLDDPAAIAGMFAAASPTTDPSPAAASTGGVAVTRPKTPAAAATDVPAAQAAPVDASGDTLLLLVVAIAILFGLAGLFFIATAVLRRRDEDPVAGTTTSGVRARPHHDAGSVDMVPADPCEDLRAAAERAEAAAAAAADAAVTTAREQGSADDAAAAAKKSARRATADKAAADRELGFAGEPATEGSSATDDRGTITQRDLGLRRAASREAWDRYQSGAISAPQLEAQWEELGERGAIERLREADEQHREARLDAAMETANAADEADAAARAAAERTAAEADAAAQAAHEAAAASESAANEASDARAAADECDGRMRQQYADAEAARRLGDAERREELARREAEPPIILEEDFRPVGGGGGGEPKVCCPCGTWLVGGSQVAGTFGIWGTETTKIWAVCTCDASIYVEMTCTTTRWGLGLGGEANAVGGVLFAKHASEVPGGVKAALDGVNWDVSLGLSAAKAVKGATQGAELGQALATIRALAAARKAGLKDVVPLDLKQANAAAEVVRNLTRGGAKSAGKSGAKQGVQQTSGIRGIIMPVGAGLQVGVWQGRDTKVYVLDSSTCGCSVWSD